MEAATLSAETATPSSPDTTTPDGSRHIARRSLLMPVGHDWYLLDMRWVLEVVADPVVTELPTAPSTVLGLFNMRGEIVPLLDTGVLLGFAPVRSTPFALVVETPMGPAGLAATDVPESVELGPAIGRAETPGTTTSHSFGLRIAALLDLEALLAPARIGVS